MYNLKYRVYLYDDTFFEMKYIMIKNDTYP